MTLVDNIFFNSLEYTSVSGNLLFELSDHLTQFLILEGFAKEPSMPEFNIFKINYKFFNEAEFEEVVINGIDWEEICMLRLRNPNVSVKNFVDTLNFHLDEMAPFEKVTKKQYSLMLKPWITHDILKKCDEKNKLLKQIKDESDPLLLTTLRQQYKNIRNSITNEKRANKKAYFAKRFVEIKNNSSKVWKEIKSLNFERREDLDKIMYKPKELESVFVEIEVIGKKNQIYGCIYKHPCMDIDSFNEHLENLLVKLDHEKKTSYLMGDFNMDLLKTESDDKIGEYYGILTSHLFVPHITIPTRITSTSKTLIDNIFSNDPNFMNGVSGNFTFSISDHLPQFLIMPDILSGPPKKHNIYKRQKITDKEQLVADILNVDWRELISPTKMDANYSLDKFLEKSLEIVNRHAPLKKMSKKDFKLEAKPWITPGILASIKRRDLLLRKCINAPEGENFICNIRF